MAKGQEAKTNAVREVEASGLSHQIFTWECPEAMGGLEVAQRLGQDPERVFKTLVTRGKSGEHYVFLVPVVCSLNLKKAAHAVGEKSIEMIKDRELLPLTGYIHGGCSPFGMKKQFTTVVDETAQLQEAILFSGGRLGCQILMAPDDLAQLVPLEYADITA